MILFPSEKKCFFFIPPACVCYYTHRRANLICRAYKIAISNFTASAKSQKIWQTHSRNYTQGPMTLFSLTVDKKNESRDLCFLHF